ncbi:ribonuclease HI [Chitinophaga niastensis]|uniref:ribonuclease H n=1 Tax=Chitinophaga niastensis TaxID=536980 RepID=A0A2P8HDF9_CHINA|nr:RNase H family protein [Chitinophaga niastensis]PSL44263.1 ribonuclease HI [Chitinophaga niastensis]
MTQFNAVVYTDGSCHTQLRTGAWVAILLIGTEKIILSETVTDTTHNRMELTAVIAAIQHVLLHYPHVTQVQVFSDSQYVINLPDREAQLMTRHFITKKGNELQNSALVKTFLQLLTRISVELVKIKAHQKKSEAVNYNIEADMLSRKLVREKTNGI